jgi:hypothetical protein
LEWVSVVCASDVCVISVLSIWNYVSHRQKWKIFERCVQITVMGYQVNNNNNCGGGGCRHRRRRHHHRHHHLRYSSIRRETVCRREGEMVLQTFVVCIINRFSLSG